MSATSDGYVFVLEELNEGGPRVFDSSGRFVRHIGGVGSGPGEYRLAMSAMPDERDSLWVFDARVVRRSMHGSRSPWIYVRSTRGLSRWSDIQLLPGGLFVASAVRARSAENVTLLQLHGPDGQLVRGFADAPSPPPGSPSTLTGRALARSRAGVFAGHRLQYRIDEWSLDGRLLRVLRRNVDWFVPRTTDLSPTSDRAPSPTIQSMRLDSTGALWIVITRAGVHWRNGVGEPSVRMGQVTGWKLLDRLPQHLYETVVEVIDPSSGGLLASTTIPGFFPWLINGGRIGGYRTDADQVPVVVTRTLRLQGAR
jgi:hypothetical protein